MAGSYFGAGKLGLTLAFHESSVTAIWPPTGVALAAVLIWGRGMWPAVALGAFLANITTAGGVPEVLGITTGNTLEALAGAYLLGRVDFRRTFDRTRDVLALAVLAGVLSTMLSATIGVFSLWAAGRLPSGAVASTWRVWWLGDMGGDLLIAPAVLLISSRPRISWPPRRIGEAVGLALALTLVAATVFRRDSALAYTVFPLLFWTALRFRQAGAVTAGLLVSGFAVWCTAHGRGPFSSGSPDLDLLKAQTFVGVATITALLVAAVRAEEHTASETERRLAEAQQLAQIGSWEWLITSNEVTWSAELCRIYGVERTGFRASYEAFLDLVHPDDRAMVGEKIGTALRDLAPFEFEHRIVRPDGEIRTLQAHGEVLTGAAGQAVKMTGTGQDVTEQRKHEEARLRLAAIVESSNDAIISKTLSGTIVSWNGGAEMLYGYTAEEAIGMSSAILVPAERRGDESAVTNLVTRGDVDHMETARITKDGRLIDVALTVSPIRDSTGAVTGVATIARDITQRKRTEAALAWAHEQAIEASRLKSEFVANMSHEIRTPLNGVIGMSHLLLGTDLSEGQREYADAVRASGDALLVVVDDVLDFSKIEAGKLEIDSEPFKVRPLVEDAASMAAAAADAKVVELISLVDARVPEVVAGDGHRVRQVLTNLITNAVKFTPGGEVSVLVTARHGTGERIELRFEVADTGIGIAQAALERIFAPFAQADGSTTRRYGGTGLGLAISRRLVDLMGGEIGVESVEGEGSTFWFTVPVAAAAGTPGATERDELAGVRAIVVDDGATSRTFLQRQLTSWGMVCETAADAQTAIETLRAGASCGKPYALALIDWRMPGMSGIELARVIRAEPALGSVRILILTGSERARAAADEAGFGARLTKPIRESRLREEIARVLGADRAGPACPAGPAGPDGRAGDRGAGAAPGSRKASPSRRPILVAEDNVVNQLVAVRLLEQRGFAVEVAANGREALDMFRAGRYAAIFMDCQMPELDGYDATGEIRRTEGAGRHVPIIAMTANTMAGDRERCLAAGMDEYVGKPIKSAVLDRVIATILGQSCESDFEPAGGLRLDDLPMHPSGGPAASRAA